MPPILRFLVQRTLSIPITLWVITMVLYGFVMLTPPQVRATLYYPSGLNTDRLSEEQLKHYNDMIIKRYHLGEIFPIQYSVWAFNLLRGNWGYSPVHHEKVLPALLRRSPVTAELAIYSILIFIPLGLISGIRAGHRPNSTVDNRFRLQAFIAMSLPPFVMALVLMSIFYVGLHWFPPERLGIQGMLYVNSSNFHQYTGFLTIDGFLNRRPDISLEAIRHLVLPVLTLSLCYWGILGRVTRATVIEEQAKEYVTAAKARGIPERRLVWKHVFRNALTPALTSSVLSAAALFTSIFIVEIIYNFPGISSLVIDFSLPTPDAPTLLGFGVYSVLIVLFLMFVLDLIIATFDPRVREGVLFD